MFICAAGDCHGLLQEMYEIIETMEREVGQTADLLLQVGDLGVWPDAQKVDKATQKHGSVGDFPRWYAQQQAAPRPTIFIPGNHEDFSYLRDRPTGPILPGLTFLAWGDAVSFEAHGETLRVGGVGGCYSPKSFEQSILPPSRRRNYAKSDLERLLQRHKDPLDVLLFHDAPAGVVKNLREGGPRQIHAQSEGHAEAIAALRPRICFTGHLHIRTERIINGVRTIGLSKVPYPGSVLFLEVPPKGDPVVLLEWGGRSSGEADQVEVRPWVDPDVLPALERALRGWAERLSGGRPLDRDTRKRLHGLLAKEPLRPVYMSALTGADLLSALSKCVPSSEWAALLARWDAQEWPLLSLA